MSNGDPIGCDEPRGKSRAERKGRYDGSYTGTEQRTKNRLMNQFRRTGEGPGGNSEAYRNASCWCECGRLKADGLDICRRCLNAMLAPQNDGGPSSDDPHPALFVMVPRVTEFDTTGSTRTLAELVEAADADPQADLGRALKQLSLPPYSTKKLGRP